MKFAIAALTLASALLSGSVEGHPVRRACPVKHHTTTTVAGPTTTATTVTTVTPTATSTPAPEVPATTPVPSSVLPSSSAADTPRATPTPIVAPVTGGSGPHPKRGLSYNKVADTMPFGDSSSWAYNWGQSNSGATLGQGVQYVPMLWGGRPDDLKDWHKNAEAAITAGAKAFLGFNEPDLREQANLTPDAAAALWKEHMNPYAGRVRLVSPAPTNGPADKLMGDAWLDAFFKSCNGGCHVDDIAIHIYDAPTNVQYFKNYISDFGKKYADKKIWVSEFGLNSGSTAEQQTFITEMTTFLDGLDSVSHYAYFGIPANTFVSNGALLPAGETYRTA